MKPLEGQRNNAEEAQRPEAYGDESQKVPDNDNQRAYLSTGRIFLVILDLGRLLVKNDIFVPGDFLSHLAGSVAHSRTDFKYYSLVKSQKI